MIKQTIPYVLLDVIKKPKGGFLCIGIDSLGNTVKMHTYANYGTSCSEHTLYLADTEIHDITNTPGYTYHTLKRLTPAGSITPSHDYAYQQAGHTLTSWYKSEGLLGVFSGQPINRIRDAVAAYLTRPTRFSVLDEHNVWQHAKTVKTNLNTAFEQTADTRIQAYSYAAKKIVDINRSFFDEVTQIKRPYHSQMKWMTTEPGNFHDSQLTSMLTQATDKEHTVNEFPTTGISLYVDSATLQVAFKERHISDIFLYFAINSWMHKTKCYPNAPAGQVLSFIQAFIKNPRIAKAGRACLFRLHNIGLLKLDIPTRGGAKHIKEDTTVSLLSQQKYISKYEAKWNAVRDKGYNPKFIIGKPSIVRDRKWYPESRLGGKNGQGLTKASKYLDWVWQPYFTIYANKTAKMDTGFIHLLNCGKVHMMSWLYEHIVSSWAYPSCRTKIASNLLITPSTQRMLEKVNLHLLKRYNFLEIPDYMGYAIASDAMHVMRHSPKFKCRDGKLYRQEGNDFTSDRVKWKESETCGRFRLSPKFIKAWQLSRPAHTKNYADVCSPHYRPVPDRVLRGQPMPMTYVSKKAELKTGNCFALRKNGLAIPTTNPANWEGFEPLAEYDKLNGDLLVPQNPSFLQKSRKLAYGGRNAVVETTDLSFFSTLKQGLSGDPGDLPSTVDHFRSYNFPGQLF